MRLGGNAAYLQEIHTTEELRTAVAWAEKQQLPIIMIGGGSNIVWADAGFGGLVLVNALRGIEIAPAHSDRYSVTIGAGEVWDDVVERTVAAGLTGIEALSLIPGTAGATPVQNVGAYGQEIADTLTSVEAYDLQQHDFVSLLASDCAFGYRTSRFKTTDKHRYLITAITLELVKSNPQPPYYGAVQAYFDAHDIQTITPRALREAVVDIRSHKLPDPAHVANNGSFFGNPIVEQSLFTHLATQYAELPHWPVDNMHVKLSAAWLIEQAGFKDAHDTTTGMATWPTQPLVLVNEHARSTADLLAFRDKIIAAVHQKFDITLTQEPELLP